MRNRQTYRKPTQVLLEIVIDNLEKVYPAREERSAVTVFTGLKLTIGVGDLVTVFGPNGCGKSTLIRILAGLDSDYRGQVVIAGRAPGDANVGYMFQNFGDSLLPWRSVLENIAFPLALRGADRVSRSKQVTALIAELGLEKKKIPLEARTYELSGGQQQLVCSLRALIGKPDLLLLDEPFSALDFETRMEMNDLLLLVASERRLPMIVISHDLDEAMYLGTRLVLMGPCPRGIIGEIPLSYEQPRKPALLQSEQFSLKRASVLKQFLQGIQSCATG